MSPPPFSPRFRRILGDTRCARTLFSLRLGLQLSTLDGETSVWTGFVVVLDSNDERPINNISKDLRQRNLLYDIVIGYKITTD